MFFDAHNHLNNELFDDSWRTVVEGAREAGVVGMINNGGDLISSRRAVEQAEAVEGVWAAVGIHPEDLPLKRELVVELEELGRLARSSKKIVAIGELGLDALLASSVKGEASRERQLELIEPQLALAEELDLPVVLHVRDVAGSEACFEDMVRLLRNFRLRGQFHCWTGTVRQMEKVLDLDGFMISFSGILTYGSAEHIAEVARLVPAERMLVETDGPFLVPEPARTEMRRLGLRNHERLCLPDHVIMTATRLAGIRGISVEKVGEITTNNASLLFGV